MSYASIVMVKCPTTGREISTGVEMDAATFERVPESSSVCSNARLAVHQQSKCGERLGRLGGAKSQCQDPKQISGRYGCRGGGAKSQCQGPKQIGGRYGCRGGATNELVSTAQLFFVRQLSSRSSAARL